MGKTKKSKSLSSDAVRAKQAPKPKKLNPFEVHLNKEKFSILGRKCKHDKGLPGVSRAKAVKKRKETIGKEFNDFRKVNVFKDRRLGSRNPVADDVATSRFVKEKILNYDTKKKNIFNLDDDEILTHKGQTLEEIERFDDVVSDDPEDEELDAQFTEAAHFGGENNETDRKTAIEDLIAEAKRKKLEITKDKEEVFQLTTELDENYKSLLPIMGKLKKTSNEKRAPKDDFDRLLKQMIFEPRGEVTDKLESESELLEKEKVRLEKLEKERLARMRGETNEEKPTHKSADDLDDGYFAGSDGEENENDLAYNSKGEASKTDHRKLNGIETDSENKSEDSGDEESDENEIDEEDNLSDLKSSDGEAEDLEDKDNTALPKIAVKPLQEAPNHTELDENKKTQLQNKYEMPATYAELQQLLIKEDPNDQKIIVERIIDCNHPKLNSANRCKMVKLFAFLMQYLNDVFWDASEENIARAFNIFDRLSIHFYDLLHMNPEETSMCLMEIIKEKYNDYKENPKHFPTIDFVIFFKLISNLYSTSDFRHTIVTPVFILLSHLLSRTSVKDKRDISCGLFIVTVILEYTQLSMRFLPAALNFLQGVLFLAIPKTTVEVCKVVPPFHAMADLRNMLVLNNNCDITEEELLNSRDLVISAVDTSFKVRAINTSLKLLHDFMNILKDVRGVCYLAEPNLYLLERLPIENYPEFVQQNYINLKNTLEFVSSIPLQRLVAKEKRPKALKLMEPRIEKVYDDKRRPKMSKEKEMRAIMVHKVKRETKGAVREIRRDAAFINKMQIQRQIQSDLERKEKVKRIFSDAAAQQGELNSLERKRKKM